MEIRNFNLVSMYELVKEKYPNVSEKNIKLKSIQELITHKELRTNKVYTSKDKRATQNQLTNLSHADKEDKSSSNVDECIFKERQINHFIFKRKDSSNSYAKLSKPEQA